MKDFFGEKSTQVEPYVIVAFGITLSSRYGKADELIEMIKFAKYVATQDTACFVNELRYDSQSQCCFFDVAPSVDPYGDIAARIRSIAKKTIRQFELFDCIEHGPGLLEEEDKDLSAT